MRAVVVGSTDLVVATVARVVVVGSAVAGLVEVTLARMRGRVVRLLVAPAVAGLVTSGETAELGMPRLARATHYRGNAGAAGCQLRRGAGWEWS